MRFFDLTYLDLHLNLAVDEALLQEVESGLGGPALRVWEQPSPAVVLGASGRIGADVERENVAADDVILARRSSGGGTVVIGPGALNFAVIVPIDDDPAYAAVDSAQRAVLARCAAGFNLYRVGTQPLVQVLGSGDLTVERRKCSGSAQRRLRRHFLVHASILYDFPLASISRYLRPPGRQPAYREGRAHEEFVANLNLPRATLVRALRSVWDATDERSDPSPELLKSARELVETKFARPEWIERL